MSSARTMPANSSEFSFAVSGVGPLLGSCADVCATPFPQLEFMYRRGLTDWAELGLKAFPVGLSADLKLSLFRAESEFEGFNLSVAPGVLASWHPTAVASLPLYVGYRFAGHEIVLGPRVMYSLAGNTESIFGGGGPLYAGGGVGTIWRVDPKIRLHLESTVLIPTAAPKEPYLQGNIGLSFLTN